MVALGNESRQTTQRTSTVIVVPASSLAQSAIAGGTSTPASVSVVTSWSKPAATPLL